jgi:hypothetical protein
MDRGTTFRHEYMEQAAAESRKGVVLQLGGSTGATQFPNVKTPCYEMLHEVSGVYGLFEWPKERIKIQDEIITFI